MHGAKVRWSGREDIADFQLPIADFFRAAIGSKLAIGNWQLAIGNDLWLNTKRALS